MCNQTKPRFWCALAPGHGRLDNEDGKHEFLTKQGVIDRAVKFLTTNPTKEVFILEATQVVKSAAAPVAIIDLAP